MSRYIDESAFTDSVILGSERTPEYIDAKKYESELRLKANEKAKIVGPGQDYENGYWTGLTYARWLLNEMPGADVEPMEHGEWWNEYDDYSVAKCSNCGATFDALGEDERYSRKTLWELFKRSYSHCPNCGALMDEDEEDENEHEEMYAIPNGEPPTYTPEEKAKITEWCEEAGIDPNMIRGMKEPPKMDGGSKYE